MWIAIALRTKQERVERENFIGHKEGKVARKER